MPHTVGKAKAGTVLVAIGVALELAMAAVLGVVRTAGATVGQRHVEGPLPPLAIVVVFATPGLLALSGWRTRRPTMIAAAGVACIPLALVSIAAFPILLPAVLFFTAFGRAEQPAGAPGHTVVVILGSATATVMAAGLLVVGMRQYTYSYAGGGDSGSYVPASHAVAALALVAVNLALTTLAASPGDASTPPGG